MAGWFGYDSAQQIGGWNDETMDAHIALFPVDNPCAVAFAEASDLLVAAGYVVATLDNDIYINAHRAMMNYAASLWLQRFREGLDYVASESGRDGAKGNLDKRIGRLQNQALSYWLQIDITPAWAPNASAYNTEVIKR